jgi:putative endonuclease
LHGIDRRCHSRFHLILSEVEGRNTACAATWQHVTAHVYILRCADGSYYVGSTRTSLEQRIAQHNTGTLGGYTARRRPVALAFHQEFDRITDAIAAERQLKGWTRAKKAALIGGDFSALHALAKGKT